MQVTETNNEGLKREFKIVVPGKDITTRLEAQLSNMKGRLNLPGFRPGKAPMSLLKKLHGKNLIGQVLEETINEMTGKALEERNLRPALQPRIEITSFEYESEGNLEYNMTVEIVPAIDVPDFSKVTLERLTSEVDDGAIDAEIERFSSFQKNFTEAPKTKKAENGDAVLIDFVGKRDGVAFEGGTAEGHLLELGSGQFIPGFEEQLIGAKAGDEKTLTVTFPEQYGSKDLAGKEVTFDVTVQEVRVSAPVEINDEFAKNLGLESLEALRNTLKDRLGDEIKSLSRQRLKRSLLDALADSEKFDVPEGMIELEFQQIWQHVLNDLNQEAHAHHDHAHGEACDHEIEEPSDEVKEEYRGIAERRVRLGLLLAEVGQKNNIIVPQDDVSRLVAREARRYPGQEKQVFEYYQQNPQALAQLRAPLYEDKVVDFILELVKVTEKSVTRDELKRAVEEDDELPEVKAPEKKKAAKKAKGDDAVAAEEKPKKAAAKKADADGEAKPKKAPAKKAKAKEE
ncbi:trigger factor [Govanella unica]|uniref:Trigger factor n=1 Tax=Govanella unica TaxID=2975056 RepID=A0A9X3TY09_9PROT|nr:trigger factor [Govania unica]MDA5193733.1 trigger factor [Govania unica]